MTKPCQHLVLGLVKMVFVWQYNTSSLLASIFDVNSLVSDSPLQVLLLNTKKLVRDLYNKMRPSQPPSSDSLPSQNYRHQPRKNPKTGPSTPVQTKPRDVGVPRSSVEAKSASARKAKSRALLASNSYLLFSYLIPWSASESLDALCHYDLLLQPPQPLATFGLQR